MMNVNLDRTAIKAAYDDVRSDSSDTNWLILGYNEQGEIVVQAQGSDYSQMKEHMTDDVRIYSFARYYTGDEMSKRAKFVFITWIGTNVPPLKKAKTSTDKSNVKEVICNFALEMSCDDKEEIKDEAILSALEKAGGAAYGTGNRN